MSDRISWLQQPDIQQRIIDHQEDDPLQLLLKWKKEDLTYPQLLSDQIISRKKVKSKIPFLAGKNLVYPPPLSVEQSSTEETATFKQQLFRGSSCVDMTGGAGIDALFLSRSFEQVHYVERDRWLCEIARYNFKILGADNIQVHQADAESYSLSRGTDLVYVDPDRRVGASKATGFTESDPQVVPLIDHWLKQASNVLIKASPMIDISDAVKQLRSVRMVYVIAVGNEVREVLFHLIPNTESLQIRAVDVTRGIDFVLNPEEENKQANWVIPERGILHVPNKALTKAGAFNSLAHRMNLMKLGPHTHIYHSDQPIAFPGRSFRILEVLKGKKAIGGRNADVISRNYHLTADQFREKYGIRPGNGTYFIVAAGRGSQSRIYWCEKLGGSKEELNTEHQEN